MKGRVQPVSWIRTVSLMSPDRGERLTSELIVRNDGGNGEGQVGERGIDYDSIGEANEK